MWTHWRNMKKITPQLGTEISRQEPERKCKGNRWEPYWKALVVWYQALAVRCQVVSCIMEAQFRVTKNDTEYLFCFSKTACVIGRQNLGGCGKLSQLTASLFSISSPYFTAIADGRLRSSFSGSNSSLWPWTGTGTRHYLWWKSCTRDEVLVSSEKSGRPDSWVRVRYGIGSYMEWNGQSHKCRSPCLVLCIKICVPLSKVTKYEKEASMVAGWIKFDSCLLHHFFNYRVLLYSQEELEFRMKEVQAQDVGPIIFYISQLISALIEEISHRRFLYCQWLD